MNIVPVMTCFTSVFFYRAVDVLVPGVGELCGGSQREERYDVLLARIEELKLDVKDYGNRLAPYDLS